ncbi:unnamed protein product [Linum tenue]|uniref:Uncharacterized protein n=1 Tax=Linum tenue TaxID=586396 RepID=A0AAV0J3P1_9ROSI|nr:unnamed protein product [Linum tenue]
MEAATGKKKTKKRKKDVESRVRKGTWKAEEDQVLLKHVEQYGPREWSSIRSKGLLQRTGKSCRLRWVNKLQPNLKGMQVYRGGREGGDRVAGPVRQQMGQDRGPFDRQDR